MNCCPACFLDKEIIGFIQTNSTQQGHCNFCGADNTSILPCSELYETFQDLILTYKNPSVDYGGSQTPQLLFHHLKSWKIFNSDNDDLIDALTKQIGSTLQQENFALFNEPVIARIFEEESYQQTAEHFITTWTHLKEEIKHTNRFFLTNQFDFSQFKNILTPFEKRYRKGKLFYRARNSEYSGIDLDKMGRPPAKLASGGRANPQGISYLYISNDIKTTIYEVRSTLYDYVTVAEFELTEEIRIASLRNLEKISPFLLEDISTYLLHRNFLSRIESDLIKPLRRHDSELDYLPTQYLCEYIKSLDYDGVEYSSSLNQTGFNIALFDDKKVKAKSTKVYEVKDIQYTYNEYFP